MTELSISGAGTSDSSSHFQVESLLFPTMLKRRPVLQRPEYVETRVFL